MMGFTALWTLSFWPKVWTLIFGITLLFFMTGFITLWMLSRKIDKTILNRIEIR
jgi:hypothetical protein